MPKAEKLVDGDHDYSSPLIQNRRFHFTIVTPLYHLYHKKKHFLRETKVFCV